jgi:KDO2-lipid IV(A) lauroyltransferase
VIAAIRKGTSIGFLIDQNLSPKHGGIFVDFRGLPVPSSPLPAIVALRYGVQLVSGTCVRKANGRFKMQLSPVPVTKDDDKFSLTQKIIAANESLIVKYPEQYIWLYQRWKYIPSDIPTDLKAKYPYYAKEKGYMVHPDAKER